MVPAGEPTEKTIQTLTGILAKGDTIIDGGNSKWKDDIRRARELAPKGIHYVDAGTSGGVWGLQNGYCLMVGGDKEPVTAAGADLHDARARRTAGCTWAPPARGTT